MSHAQADVDKAVAAAQRAFTSYSRSTPLQRLGLPQAVIAGDEGVLAMRMPEAAGSRQR